MSKRIQAAKSASIIILLSLGGKFFGFIREMLISAKFGSGIETDTYLIALSAIALFSGLITRSLNTTMIPVLSDVEKAEGKYGKVIHTNNLLNIVSAISFIIMTIAVIGAPLIIKVVAPGFVDENQFKMAALLMRIGIPSIWLSGMQGVFRGFLQTEGSFFESAASTFLTNFIYIIFLILFASIFGIKGLMVTMVLGSLAQVGLQIFGIRKFNYKYRFFIDLKDEYVKKIMYLIPPVLISVGISDVNAIIDKAMASSLVDGSISALNYSEKLNNLVVGIFISAITTVMFPMLAKEATKDNYEGLKKTTINGINLMMLITIPATVGMIILSHPIVKAAYERGKFDSTATIMTAGALVFATLKMTTMSINTLLNNALYSLQDTKAPLFIAVIAVVVNVVFNFILIGPMTHRGLALATTISSIVSCLIRLYILRAKIGVLGYLNAIKCGLKALLASAVMGAVVYLLYNYLITLAGGRRLMEFVVLAIAAGLGAIVYFIIILLLKIDEVKWITSLVKAKLKRG